MPGRSSRTWGNREDDGRTPSGRDALAREGNTHIPLRFPTWRHTATLIGRVLRLRCPHCGGGPVIVHWLNLRERCGACGLDLERGEGDYFIGAMLFNLVLAEAVFAAVLGVVVLARWPAVPWDALRIAVPLGMLVAPVGLFPFSTLAWLAFDLAFRPEPSGPTEG